MLADEGANRFRALFGRAPTVTAEAPGRVNLIGEHTDYNGGFVLPAPIPQRCRVWLAPREDDTAAVATEEASGAVLTYRIGEETPGRGWLDYVQGVTRALADRGQKPGGFDAWISSEVPLGSGLSSSASLEVSLLRALRDAFQLPIDDVCIAEVGQEAENTFVGARVGVMDQMAASLGREGDALFLDTRSLSHELVPLPKDAELLVISSGVRHALAAGGGYNTRRAECERACELLGVEQLRDLDETDLRRVEALPEPLNRRARHIVTENARVLAAVRALRAGDLPELGRLFDASHESQRDDFEVSVPEIDLLVSLARAERDDVYGARLTGGGFGGSILALVRRGRGRVVGERIAAAYEQSAGQTASVLVPTA